MQLPLQNPVAIALRLLINRPGMLVRCVLEEVSIDEQYGIWLDSIIGLREWTRKRQISLLDPDAQPKSLAHTVQPHFDYLLTYITDTQLLHIWNDEPWGRVHDTG